MVEKKWIINMLLAIMLSIAIISCVDNKDSRLVEIENLIDDYPDSAKIVIERIDPSTLLGSYNKALYGLLLTQALDRNHIDLSDDSIMSRSVDYFKDAGDFRYRIMANYYNGRVQYSKGQFNSAILSFFKAKEIADNRGEYFWAGMACRGISDIYCDMYNTSEEEFFAEKEYINMSKSGRQPYLNYALNDYCRSLYNNDKIDEAIHISELIADSAILYNDAYLGIEASRLKTACLVSKNKLDEAYEIAVTNCRNQYAECKDSLLLGYILILKGKFDESEEIVTACKDDNLLLINNIKYNKYKKSGHFDKANRILENTDSIKESILKSSLTHGFTGYLTEYFELNKKLDEIKINSYNTRMWLIVLFCLILIILIVVIAIHMKLRYKLRIEEKVNYAIRLQKSLQESMDREDLTSATIRKLFADKYGLIEKLSEIIIQNKETKSARKKIADTITNIIEQLSIRSDTVDSLEKEINDLYDNLFTDFRKDLPGLKEEDYRLFLFSILGFSNITISLLLKEDKIEAVYNRRRRLKNKVNMLAESKRTHYIKFL